MSARLFVVSFPVPTTVNPDTGMLTRSEETFVAADDIPDAFARFTRAHPMVGHPSAVREAGPVAQNVMRKLLNKRALL
jgi:hypothetical protein